MFHQTNSILNTQKKMIFGNTNNYGCQLAIKNIGLKMIYLSDITFNKRLGNLIGRSFEIPNVSYT